MTATLTDSELSAFSEQLAMILHSGISTLEGVSILREDLPSGEGRKIMDQVYEALEETGELAEALRRSNVYPEYYVKMTEIGERSGTLDEVMDSLADHYARQDALRRSIHDALTYPLVLLGMLLAILIVLITQVMPVFREVFDQLGIEMTGISSTVFQISTVVQRIAIAALILVIAGIAACLILMRSKKGRKLLTRTLYRIPFIRRIRQLLSCAHFSDALSLALHSGLDMGESFSLASALADQTAFANALQQAGALIDQGNDLGESLRQAGIFSGLNARMFSIGFRTGSAETALRKISVSCQEEANIRIESAVGALEPTLTAVLCILTGLILVSVMLPLLGVMANIG
jgi:type IV pilus assembly protein PilC